MNPSLLLESIYMMLANLGDKSCNSYLESAYFLLSIEVAIVISLSRFIVKQEINSTNESIGLVSLLNACTLNNLACVCDIREALISILMSYSKRQQASPSFAIPSN